jgi:hypothetical protein
VEDEFRVEVDLDDDEHGYSLTERLRALDLDDAARTRLAPRVVVTRDGAKLFLYAASEQHAREAERVVRSLVEEDGLSAEITVTRWHPIQEEWLDASLPLPGSDEQRRAEYESRKAAEAQEAASEGEFDWHVVVHLPGRDEAADLATRLAADGVPAARRWRYVVAGAVTREQADELAARLRREAAPDVEVEVEANLSDLPATPFVFLPF